MALESVFVFVLASVLISLAPGPDNIFVMTQSALFGKKAGIYITLGLCTGLMVHTLAVAFGLAVLMQTSAWAFNVITFLGAGYLIYLAWMAFKSAPSQQASNTIPQIAYRTLFVRGIFMNVTNPKVALFFLAFLPQFTHPDFGNMTQQFVVLGIVFILVAFSVFCLIALLASVLGPWLFESSQRQLILNYITGIVFVGIAVNLVISTITS